MGEMIDNESEIQERQLRVLINGVDALCRELKRIKKENDKLGEENLWLKKENDRLKQELKTSCDEVNFQSTRAINAETENEKLREAAKEEYYRGKEAGIREFAWWKDGVQYVGTCGNTLEDALKFCVYEALSEEAKP